MASRKKRKDSNRAGKICIGLILAVFMVAMSAQIYKVYQKDQEYAEIQAEKEEELEAQQERQEELKEYENSVDSTENIENTARSKLGLVYDDEIIFKENKD